MVKSRGKLLNQTIFSDEMGMNLSEAYPKRAWQNPRKKVKVEKPRKDVRVNCWGGISKNGATSLTIFKGGLTGERYQQIVDEHIEEMSNLYTDGFKFQHDNHRAHTYAEPWMVEQGLSLVKFPSYSPDLNPIENLWSALKTQVALDKPTTEKQLIRSLEKHWNSLTETESLQQLFEDLYSRYRECIQLKGDLTPH